MVDYTKPEYRDETWKRWQGGDKLAQELRAFYTNQRVFDRLGQSTPMASTEAAASPWWKGRRAGNNDMRRGGYSIEAQQRNRPAVDPRVQAKIDRMTGKAAPVAKPGGFA